MPQTPLSHSAAITDTNYLGPHKMPDGGWQFKLWAPKPQRLDLLVRRDGQTKSFAMRKDSQGLCSVVVDADAGLADGDKYCFRIDGNTKRPDPTARAYVSSVHGWCKLVDHASYRWGNENWKGVAKDDLVIYELHLGTFTEVGTFNGAVERLDELVDLGVTAIEILPIAQTPGRWNWGYDGVGLFSVENAYGSPHELKQLVDACHQRGLAIILDVVYNHLGPEGNYLSEFGPYFTNKHHTPWGSAWNFDDKDNHFVRAMMLQNVAMWIEDYQFDGLRLDAVHFMFDDSAVPISIDIAHRFDRLRETTGRQLHLIGETNVHSKTLVKSSSPFKTGFDAVWSDCLMHSLLGIAQPGLDLCHRKHDGAQDAALALEQGFLYENYPYERHDRGERADLHSFVIGLQNHDTVGNHPQGKRLTELANREFQAAASMLYLMYPAIPMLFMGEEFCCQNPFLFFVEFGDPRVRDAVEKGRASEFPEMLKLSGMSPLDPQAFQQSKMGGKADGDLGMWNWYQALISLRKQFRKSGVLCGEKMEVMANPDVGLFQLKWETPHETLVVAARLGAPGQPSSPLAIAESGEVLLSTRPEQSAFDGTLDLNDAVMLLKKG